MARSSHRASPALGALRASPAVIPAALAICLLLALAAEDAGYFPSTWYPAAVFLVALTAMTLVALGLPSPPRSTTLAVGLLTAFVVWCIVSAAWADQQGAAWDAGNRAVVALMCFALFALWPIGAREAGWLLGAFALGVTAIGVVELLRLGAATDPEAFMVDARLSEPAGYVNANAALWSIAAWPCLALAAGREVPAWLRGIFLGAAGLLETLALMSQSRGWIIATPLALIAVILAARARARLFLTALVAAAGVFAAAGPALAIHNDAGDVPLTELADDAVTRTLTVALVLVAVGVVAALVDRRVAPASRVARAGRVAAAVAAVGLVVAIGVGTFAATDGEPFEKASEAWEDFKGGGNVPFAGEARLVSAGSNRYDFWVVAWELFRDEPLLGVGADNYQADYLQRGNSGEEPRYPHSFELAVLSQTGVIGALLLLGALVGALVSALRSRSRGSPLGATVVAGALGAFAYWLAHTSVDWLWEVPALAGAAFAMLGLAASGAPRESVRGMPARIPRALAPAAAALLLAILAVSLVPAWLATRHVDRAAESWGADPEAAFERLDSAASLNPLSSRPYLVEGTIAFRLDRTRRAEEAFKNALERDPESSYALLQLTGLAAQRGDRARAKLLAERTLELRPRNSVLRNALQGVKRGNRVDLESLNRELLRRARERAR